MQPRYSLENLEAGLWLYYMQVWMWKIVIESHALQWTSCTQMKICTECGDITSSGKWAAILYIGKIGKINIPALWRSCMPKPFP